jgi:oligopeptide/dipeptide ABC transporter ATP-binding protein
MLEIKDLSVKFNTPKGPLMACDKVSLKIAPGRNLGLVGESGCGKSMTCLSILRLLPDEAEITSGEITYKGDDIFRFSDNNLRKLRGNKISMVFQEPMSSLNPVLTIGQQLTEAIVLHKGINKKTAKEKAINLLDKVKIDRPRHRFYEYPHNLSGGMRQRVMIAMAISLKPDILIADEPTTALDVTTQAQVLELLDELQREYKMSVLIVSHDFGVIARLADDIAVMYAGEIVEYTSSKKLFTNPLHPYTKALLSSLKQMQAKKGNLSVLRGSVGDLSDLPKGCRFEPRCSFSDKECSLKESKLIEVKEFHYVRCHKCQK